MRFFTITFLLLFTLLSVNAKPRWIRSMEKDNANYHKALKSYERYWRNHFLPSEDEEEQEQGHEAEQRHKEEEKDPRPFLVRLFQSEERAIERSNELIIQYKKFKKWQYEMRPYIKSNGHLMSKEERLKAWEKTRQY